MHVPPTLHGDATGMCSAQCGYSPTLPYNWCEGDANCLPTKLEDSLFSPSEIAVLEAACGLASGASQRPNTCTNRPGKEVDCGWLTGGVNENPEVQFKWPRNMQIANGRHSGGATPVYTNMAQYTAAATDGICDTGTCHSNGCDSGSFGTGGAAEDTDCPYDFELRDIPQPTWLAPVSKYSVTQACWDWCTEYFNTGDSQCAARDMLASGTGTVYCGYKTGQYLSATTGTDSPYAQRRCHIFISSKPITILDFSAGSGGGITQNTGPYINLWMSQTSCINNGFAAGVDQQCGISIEIQCNSSNVTLSIAEGACAAFNQDDPGYKYTYCDDPELGTLNSTFNECVYDVCTTGDVNVVD
eukprot:4352614-Prymnesium_polylepis.1